MKERKIGFVEGTHFVNGREMVNLIYRRYFAMNPSIKLSEFADEVNKYGFTTKVNDGNDRSFLKSEASYLLLTEDKQEKFYSPDPIVIDGKNYYLKTETGEPDTGVHFQFALDHGINIVYDLTDPEIVRLKNHNKELFELFNTETNSTLTEAQRIMLDKMQVKIERAFYQLPFEIVGRYDLRDIIGELEGILQTSNSVSDFRCLLESLLKMLIALLENENYQPETYEEGTFFLYNGTYFLSEDYLKPIAETENEIRSIIAKIKTILESHKWSEETARLIRDILDKLVPKIFSRKRLHSVLGVFTASEFKITLYEVAIQHWLPSEDYRKKLLDVYAHELFHAYHFLHMSNQHEWTYDGESRIVKESLARYAEYKYSKVHFKNTVITDDLIRMWTDYDMLDFPYAGAKYVNKYAGLCELMFKESAKTGTKDAYHLIDSAYKI